MVTGKSLNGDLSSSLAPISTRGAVFSSGPAPNVPAYVAVNPNIHRSKSNCLKSTSSDHRSKYVTMKVEAVPRQLWEAGEVPVHTAEARLAVAR